MFKLNDNPEDLLDSINMLVETSYPFAIVTCRSGLAIDIYLHDDSYDDKIERMAYTTFNDDSLSKTIKEAINKIKGELENE